MDKLTDPITTYVDHNNTSNNIIKYVFLCRPPYEGFVLLLLLIIIVVLIIWWLLSC